MALREKCFQVIEAIDDYETSRARLADMLDDPSFGPLVRSVSTRTSTEIRTGVISGEVDDAFAAAMSDHAERAMPRATVEPPRAKRQTLGKFGE